MASKQLDKDEAADVLLTRRPSWSWGRGGEVVYSPVGSNSPAGGAGPVGRASWLCAADTGPMERREGLGIVGQRAPGQWAAAAQPSYQLYQLTPACSRPSHHPAGQTHPPVSCLSSHQAEQAQLTPHGEPLVEQDSWPFG